MSSQMVKNVNHLVRKWYIGHLGHLKTFGEGQARFSRGFTVNTTLAHIRPWVNKTTFSAPIVVLEKAILSLKSMMPCRPGHVGTECSARSRGQCPPQVPVCSPAPGPELFSGALGLQPTGSSQGYMSKLHSSFASAFSRCRCQLEPWTPWRKTKPRAFATSFTTALQVGLMGQ